MVIQELLLPGLSGHLRDFPSVKTGVMRCRERDHVLCEAAGIYCLLSAPKAH